MLVDISRLTWQYDIHMEGSRVYVILRHVGGHLEADLAIGIHMEGSRVYVIL